MGGRALPARKQRLRTASFNRVRPARLLTIPLGRPEREHSRAYAGGMRPRVAISLFPFPKRATPRRVTVFALGDRAAPSRPPRLILPGHSEVDSKPPFTIPLGSLARYPRCRGGIGGRREGGLQGCRWWEDEGRDLSSSPSSPGQLTGLRVSTPREREKKRETLHPLLTSDTPSAGSLSSPGEIPLSEAHKRCLPVTSPSRAARSPPPPPRPRRSAVSPHPPVISEPSSRHGSATP